MTEKYVQPEMNIGLVGHVDHGKTTLVKALSGKWTDTHSEELKRGITIRLGYADFSIYTSPKCKDDFPYATTEKSDKWEGEGKLVRKISLVDAPGHESLMATMLSGATIMDGALLMIAANESCPQPQTREHLMALSIIGIKKIIIIQNKIDVVSDEKAQKNREQVKEFLKGTDFEDAPIIPMSAQYGVNVDVLLTAIQEQMPTPKRDPKLEPLMFVARSFDINKPGTDFKDFRGGVLGGTLKQGKFKEGEDIEIRPGHIIEEQNQLVAKPITTRIVNLMSGSVPAKELGPGGSIGVMTLLDPSIVKSDKLSGNIVGHPGKLPPVWSRLRLKIELLERVVGTKDNLVVDPLKKGETLMLNVNAAATVGIIQKLGKDEFDATLQLPICADVGDRVTISRRIGNRFRLIGYGIIEKI
ncbi:MAG: translation initiation factor IF-2 subunit gamma [DPANN group archaeon]|nr:translation initiation factor IF-2 subunit gamma [DPANN group archaeon]